jgi:RNA polymerase sigma factor (sigma-70 family)
MTFDAQFWPLSHLARQTAYRIVRIPAVAEDIAAETMARAALRWSRLVPPVDGWIIRVAANLAIDHNRRAWRTVSGRKDSPASSPDLAAHMDLLNEVRALPRRQREVITLRYLVDLPEDRIAELLGLSASSVKTHTRRGMAALRRSLGPEPLPKTQRGESS